MNKNPKCTVKVIALLFVLSNIACYSVDVGDSDSILDRVETELQVDEASFENRADRKVVHATISSLDCLADEVRILIKYSPSDASRGRSTKLLLRILSLRLSYVPDLDAKLTLALITEIESLKKTLNSPTTATSASAVSVSASSPAIAP